MSLFTLFLLAGLVVLAVQLGFILLVYSRTAFHRETSTGAAATQTGVSVVVCARNEYLNLLDLLPLLDAQDYPAFEVLVIDDRSEDDTKWLLPNQLSDYTHIRLIRIDTEAQHITPKKYALTIALKKAAYPLILLTDADCRPASREWLARMTAPLQQPHKELVLGVSPYTYRPGLLNFLIRSETLFTAVQYLSLALSGMPYMGVGRNLSYRRALFFEHKGFYNHLRVLGGDDDLFVNEAANARNTAVCLHPSAYTWSEPKTTWADWRRQKRRHRHIGRYYRTGHKLVLGFLVGSHVLTWVWAVALGFWLAFRHYFNMPFTPAETDGLLWAVGLFGFRLLGFWAVVGRISYRLAHMVHWLLIPIVDAGLAAYYGLGGLSTFIINRKKPYRWK